MKKTIFSKVIYLILIFCICGIGSSLCIKKVKADTYATLADLIATNPDFPTDKSFAWLNSEGDYIFLCEDGMKIEDTSGIPCPVIPLNTEVALEGDVYQCYDEARFVRLDFTLTDNVLTSIYCYAFYSQSSPVQGTYAPVPRMKVELDAVAGSVDKTLAKNAQGFNLNNLNSDTIRIYEYRDSSDAKIIEIHYQNKSGNDALLETKFTINEGCTFNGVAYTLDGINYTNITSYTEYDEEIDMNYVEVSGIEDVFSLKILATVPHTHAIKETHFLQNATCEDAGHNVYYECECGLYYTDEDLTDEIGDATALAAWLTEEGAGYIASLGHHYSGDVTYTWNNDKCTASINCDHEGCTESITETVTAEYVKDYDAACCTNEKGHYEATFENELFEKQVTITYGIEKENSAKGHNLTITYTWNEDHTKCVGTASCLFNDYDETVEANVSIENGKAIATFESDTFETQTYVFPPKEGLSGGAIAGIIIGSTVGVCLLAYVVMFVIWKKKEKGLKFLVGSFKWINTKIFKK